MLFNLRFQLATGELDNFSRINHVRKDAARMMTELRIREIGEAEGLALDDLPGHQAAARRRSADQGLAQQATPLSERRAKAKAEAAAAEDARPRTGADGDIDEDELRRGGGRRRHGGSRRGRVGPAEDVDVVGTGDADAEEKS